MTFILHVRENGLSWLANSTTLWSEPFIIKTVWEFNTYTIPVARLYTISLGSRPTGMSGTTFLPTVPFITETELPPEFAT
jgi:hypothetical protein